MNLRSKKKLIAKVLKVGVNRIILESSRSTEIKEAITRQDIRDLKKEGVIKIKEIKGRKKNIKRKTKKRGGSVRKKVNKRKQDYVAITRKLRNYVKNMKTKGRISKEEHQELRKKIKSRAFRDLAHLRDAIRKEGK